eukprot:4942468-Pyramimonas_sp.AAC.2
MEEDNAGSKLRPDAPSFVFVPPQLPVVSHPISHPPLPSHLHAPFGEYQPLPHVVIPPPPDLQVFENIAFTPSQVRSMDNVATTQGLTTTRVFLLVGYEAGKLIIVGLLYPSESCDVKPCHSSVTGGP